MDNPLFRTLDEIFSEYLGLNTAILCRNIYSKLKYYRRIPPLSTPRKEALPLLLAQLPADSPGS